MGFALQVNAPTLGATALRLTKRTKSDEFRNNKLGERTGLARASCGAMLFRPMLAFQRTASGDDHRRRSNVNLAAVVAASRGRGSGFVLAGSIGKNTMSHTDRVFALIAVAVVVAVTVGLWLTNLL